MKNIYRKKERALVYFSLSFPYWEIQRVKNGSKKGFSLQSIKIQNINSIQSLL